MNADMLRDFIKRQPFVPFTIHMNDGRKFEIQHRDFLLLPPGWSTTAIVCSSGATTATAGEASRRDCRSGSRNETVRPTGVNLTLT